MQLLRMSLVALLLLAAFVPSAQAQGIQILDYVGFGWETGGFPPSNPGDVLSFVANAGTVDPITGVDTGTEEVTCYVYGLTVAGTNTDAFGTLTLYSGGTLEVWRDAAQNADYGINPPNATSPSTFNDGTLLLRGNFTNFQMYVTTGGAGSFGGPADGVAGELITACAGCIYTWGGSFTVPGGAQVPEGYDFQIDGVLELDPTVPVEDQRAWGSLKATYGPQD